MNGCHICRKSWPLWGTYNARHCAYIRVSFYRVCEALLILYKNLFLKGTSPQFLYYFLSIFFFSDVLLHLMNLFLYYHMLHEVILKIAKGIRFFCVLMVTLLFSFFFFLLMTYMFLFFFVLFIFKYCLPNQYCWIC